MKILLIVGTRPEVIKQAPLAVAAKKYSDIVVKIISTGQHKELVHQMLEVFGLKLDYDLEIMQPGQNLYDITAKALLALREVLEQEAPDVVLVQGDTTTVFAGALAAFYQKIPVGHVEAGLRTFEKYDPYPEEINRSLVDVIADFCFAPTHIAEQNLLREGKKDKAILTGNTVVDAIRLISPKLPKTSKFSGAGKKILLTMHRRESWGEPMKQALLGIRKILEKFENLEVVFPMHPNPQVREVARKILGDVKNAKLIEPVDYLELLALIRDSDVVLTDSGGIQEEAPSFGKPVLVLRKTTERPEGVEAGIAKLVGTDSEAIFTEAEKLLTDQDYYLQMSAKQNPYGDGFASEKILEFLLKNIK